VAAVLSSPLSIFAAAPSRFGQGCNNRMAGRTGTAAEMPLVRISQATLNVLMTALEVRVVQLSECLVSPGWRLELQAPRAPGIHYSLRGAGRVVFAGTDPVALRPHTLVVVPAGWDFALEADDDP